MAWWGWRSLITMDRMRRISSIVLRVVVLMVIVMMLAGLQSVQRTSDLTVVAVIDQSDSVKRFAQPLDLPPDTLRPVDEPWTVEDSIEEFVRQASLEADEAKRTDDKFSRITYDGRPTARNIESNDIRFDDGTIEIASDGTNTAEAIRLAMADLKSKSAKRIVVFSDGNDTSGDVIQAAREAAAAGVQIDVVPMSYQVANEVMVEALYAPSEARLGQTVALRVVLRATRPSDGAIEILLDGEPVDLNGPSREGTGLPVSADQWTVEQEISDGRSGRYVLTRQIDMPTFYTGPNSFEAVFVGADEAADAMAVNNRASSFTQVAGKGKILFVNNVEGAPGEVLPRALQSRGVEMDVVRPAGLPRTLARLQRYDAVVFQNVPADLVPSRQRRMIAQYVNDLGGGFVMVGGPDSFGAGGWTNSEVDRILPVTCQIPSQTVLPSGALVVVIDRSGSMYGTVGGSNKTQMEIASEAAIEAINTLYPQDLVGVVAFDSQGYWIVDIQEVGNDMNQIASKIRSIEAGGGTNIYSGMAAAYNKLKDKTMQDAAIRHMIVITDGQSTGGNYAQLVGQMRRAGITCSTIGVGDGHDAALLNQLAQMGNGQYHPVTNPFNLPQVFIKEAKTIRKNLIKEVPFQPQLINTGSPVMSNVGGVPQLRGLVLTGEKQDPRVFTPIKGPEGEPVFAHWQAGLGRSAAFTSDATNKWAVEWLQWGGYADFWARTIRLVARPTASRDVDLVTTVENEQLTIRLDAAGIDDSSRGSNSRVTFGNYETVKGAVTKPDGTTEFITLTQTGPGLYETTLPATDAGNYIVTAIADPTGDRKVVVGGTSKEPGAELRNFQSNEGILQEIAEITGGRVLDTRDPLSAGLFARTTEFEARSMRPLWRYLLYALLVLFLLDVACRRIAWSIPEMVGWMRDRMVVQRQPDAAVATTGALRGVRQKLEQSGSTATAKSSPTPVAASTAVNKKRKFEAAKNFKASEDFAVATGSAKSAVQRSEARQQERAAQQAAAKTSASDAEEGRTTQSLLAAKRRARHQTDGDT